MIRWYERSTAIWAVLDMSRDSSFLYIIKWEMGETKLRTWQSPWLIGLFLFGAVWTLYARATTLDFINFDDDDYVTTNPHVLNGLSLKDLSWAMTSLEQVNWHPLTWMSLQLDAQLYGSSPAGYHRTNVLLHGCDTVLLFWLLHHMTGAAWRSGAVAGFFALHPVHVEPVVWVTARKDVLSTFFWLLAIAAYLGYARRPAVWRYVLVALPLALGLMAKQMLVTAPATLLLLDYWPLRRWAADSAPASSYASASPRRLILEKAPLLLLVIPAALLTLRAQAPIIHSLDDYTLYDRVANSLVSYIRYAGMAFWPTDLAILYPLPRDIPPWQPLAAFALLAAITIGVVRASRTRHYPAFGWFWFLGTLVPVIGLVQNGPQAMADRYAYVPYIGLYVLVVWGVADLCPRDCRPLVGGLAAIALMACAVSSWQQFDHWRSNEALWRHTLAATTDNTGAQTMLAKTLFDQNDPHLLPEAIEHFEAALKQQPDNVANLGNLALALGILGRLDEAIPLLERSIRLRPDHSFTHHNLGWVYERQGRLPAALKEYEIALELNPKMVQAGLARAGVQSKLGQFDLARRQLDRLIADNPQSAALHTEMGRILRQQGRHAEAAASFDLALAVQPDSVEAWSGKGGALERLGRQAEAAACYRRAVELRPVEASYRLNLAAAEIASGRPAAAAEQFRSAFELQPEWPAEFLAEAWDRATDPDTRRRDGALALRLASLVCAATGDREPQAIDVQAAAYAEIGQFDQAVSRQRLALSLLGPRVPPELQAQLTDRLHHYEIRQPYRQDVGK